MDQIAGKKEIELQKIPGVKREMKQLKRIERQKARDREQELEKISNKQELKRQLRLQKEIETKSQNNFKNFDEKITGWNPL